MKPILFTLLAFGGSAFAAPTTPQALVARGTNPESASAGIPPGALRLFSVDTTTLVVKDNRPASDSFAVVDQAPYALYLGGGQSTTITRTFIADAFKQMRVEVRTTNTLQPNNDVAVDYVLNLYKGPNMSSLFSIGQAQGTIIVPDTLPPTLPLPVTHNIRVDRPVGTGLDYAVVAFFFKNALV